MADSLVASNDALRLAQMIKARVRNSDWLYLIRKSLYQGQLPVISSLLSAVAELCRENLGNTEIITHNYDDTIESALKATGLRVSTIAAAQSRHRAGSVPVFYPHGVLKFAGGPRTSIVLAEDDYHEYSADQYGWRNLIQLNAILNSTCVFIGSSLTDPQIRRLLWVAKRTRKNRHFAFMPESDAGDLTAQRLEKLVDSQLRELNVSAIRYPTRDQHAILSDLVRRVVSSRSRTELLQ